MYFIVLNWVDSCQLYFHQLCKTVAPPRERKQHIIDQTFQEIVPINQHQNDITAAKTERKVHN